MLRGWGGQACFPWTRWFDQTTVPRGRKGPCGDSPHGGRCLAKSLLAFHGWAKCTLSLLSFSCFTRGYASSRRDVPAFRRIRTQRRCCRQVQSAPYSRRNITRNQAGTLARTRGQSMSRWWCFLILSKSLCKVWMCMSFCWKTGLL